MLDTILLRARCGASARTWLLGALDQRLTEAAWLYECRQRACTQPSEDTMRLPRAEARLTAQVAMIACDPWSLRELEACFFDTAHPGHWYVAVRAAAQAQDAACLAGRLQAVPWEDSLTSAAVAQALLHAWTPWCDARALPLLISDAASHGALAQLAGAHRMHAARACLRTMLHTRSVATEPVLRALGRIGAAEDAALLAMHLNHDDADLRAAAAWALVMHGDTQLCERFIPGYGSARISALPNLQDTAWAQPALALRSGEVCASALVDTLVEPMVPALARQQAVDVLRVQYGIHAAAHTQTLFAAQLEQAEICRAQILAIDK